MHTDRVARMDLSLKCRSIFTFASYGARQLRGCFTNSDVHSNFNDCQPTSWLPGKYDVKGKLSMKKYGISVVFVILFASMAFAQTEKVIHTFGWTDGAYPRGGLIHGPRGVMYGTTENGGSSWMGTIFEISPKGVETVLYNFTGGADGGLPPAGLVHDKEWNLYGTTQIGGAYSSGTVFELTSTGTYQVLYSFQGGTDGATPVGGLVLDPKGNLYGTTYVGGANSRGTVFEITPSGTETVLYSFTGGADGGDPYTSLIRDAKGNLYGTALLGGAYGHGAVFEITKKGVEKTLYSFAGGTTDGQGPAATLLLDSTGNLYGTTIYGGSTGNGTVFELTPAGVETILYSFAGGNDGAYPYSNLVRDKQGNFYGTTYQGGAEGDGTVYELTPGGTETVLYTFTGGNDGGDPFDGLLRTGNGTLYGTAYTGGASSDGVVFKLIP